MQNSEFRSAVWVQPLNPILLNSEFIILNLPYFGISVQIIRFP